MGSRVIDSIVESLVTGDLDFDGFMRALQAGIEANETSAAGSYTSFPDRQTSAASPTSV